MGKSNKIVRTKEILAYSSDMNPWVKLYFDQVMFPNGKEGRYNRIVESDGKPGIGILPYKKELVGLVKLYRYPVDEEVWEIPRGFGGSSSPKEEASRELLEETGLSIDPELLVYLGPLQPNTGLLDSTAQLFAADCEGIKENLNQIDEEVSEFMWFPKDQVKSMIRSFEIKDAFTLAAMYRASTMNLF